MPLTPYRILVTGSRHWHDRSTVATALDEACSAVIGRPVVIVHGGCPTGADAQAAAWAASAAVTCPVTAEPYPADWHRHGRAAGPIRNAAMVRAGANLCLAFIRQGSRGASHCARLAERAGIPVRRWSA